MNDVEERRSRGWVSLYAIAFALMIAAATVLVLAARDFLRSLTPLWISVALSAASIVVAIAGVLLPRRR